MLSLVPKAGLEPARLAPHAPQTCVSAIPPLRQPRLSWSTHEQGANEQKDGDEFRSPYVGAKPQRKRIIEVVQNACQSTSCPVESDPCCADTWHTLPITAINRPTFEMTPLSAPHISYTVRQTDIAALFDVDNTLLPGQASEV